MTIGESSLEASDEQNHVGILFDRGIYGAAVHVRPAGKRAVVRRLLADGWIRPLSGDPRPEDEHLSNNFNQLFAMVDC
jgi:hypothetical protein